MKPGDKVTTLDDCPRCHDLTTHELTLDEVTTLGAKCAELGIACPGRPEMRLRVFVRRCLACRVRA